MRPLRRTTIAAALLLLFSTASWGLGLGEITMQSHLNEPLRAQVELLDVKDLSQEDIKIRLATQEDFDRLGVDRAYFLTSIQFDVVVAGANSKIILRTDEALLEPYLDFLVEIRWPAGRLLRGYTVLVDLPKRADTTRAAAQANGAVKGASSAQDVIAQERAARADQSTGSPRPTGRPADRRYDREAEEQPRAGGQYLVQANDTLWEIAAAARPASASVEQTIVATAAMNRDAFTGGNVNGLKAGYVLQLPGENDIFLSRAEAADELALQNREWAQGIRRDPALRVVADDEFEQGAQESVLDTEDAVAVAGIDDGAGTDFEADVPAMDPSSEALSGTEMAAPQAAAESVAPAQDSGPTPPSPELAAIEARLTQLSDQVGNLRQLVTVKDQQIAALEAQLAARDAQRRDPVTASAAGSNTGGLPWWLFALGGVVVVAVAGVIYARRTSLQREAAARSFYAANAPAMQRDPVVHGRRPATEPTPEPTVEEPSSGAGSERAYGAKLNNDYAEENAISDAIAEADIYVAYGRYQQALDLLITASKAEPGNAAALLKMIEIYLKNDRREEAQALVAQIEQTHDAEAVERALAMLAHEAAATSGVDLGALGDAADSGAVPPATGVAPNLATMEFDLVEPAGGQREPTAAGGGDAAPTELALDLELPDADAAAADESGADWGEMTEGTAQEDSSKLPPELAAVLGSDVPPPFHEDDEEEEEGGLVYALDTDPMETKLDLARAYIDMGDEDGARPVLNEVISKGDLQQQAEARELLIRIE